LADSTRADWAFVIALSVTFIAFSAHIGWLGPKV
jgi:hypothetical protein